MAESTNAAVAAAQSPSANGADLDSSFDAMDSEMLPGYFGRPGSQLGPDHVFVNKSGRRLRAHRLIADFSRLLPLGATDGLVPGVPDRDLLHAVVGLYDTSLLEMTPDVLYSTICEKWGRTILVVREMSETLEYLEERRNGKGAGDTAGNEESLESDGADIKEEDDILPCQDAPPSFFEEVYSDTESEEEEEEESSEENFTRGVHKFLKGVRERRQKLKKHTGKLDKSHVGIEHRLMACLTFEKKFVQRDRVIHLTLLTVRRRYRRFGIGKYLLSELLDPVVVGQYDAIVVHADNEAVEFFKKYGFSDDVVLNSRWSELAEQFTNCSLMCYLPGFSGHSLLSMPSLPASEVFEIEQELKKWKEKNLEAYQAQVSCMMRLKHELMQLKHLAKNQREMMQAVLAENDKYRREKLRAGRSSLSEESEEERGDTKLTLEIERRLKSLEISLKTQLNLSTKTRERVISLGDGSELTYSPMKARSPQEPYDHTQDAANFYDISEQFKTSMKSDPNVKGSFQVTMITKAVPKDALRESHRRALEGLADPNMVTPLYYCGSLASQSRIEAILRDGFSAQDFLNGDYGCGLYFSKYPSRAMQSSAPGKLILASVGLGNVQTVTSKDGARKTAPKGYDSLIVAGKPQSDQSSGTQHASIYQEYVIFNPNQALPICLISFQPGESSQ